MEKIKEALKRFKAIVDSLECECDEYHGYTCTIHSDRILAKAALIEVDAILTTNAADGKKQCICSDLGYSKYCPIHGYVG